MGCENCDGDLCFLGLWSCDLTMVYTMVRHISQVVNVEWCWGVASIQRLKHTQGFDHKSTHVHGDNNPYRQDSQHNWHHRHQRTNNHLINNHTTLHRHFVWHFHSHHLHTSDIFISILNLSRIVNFHFNQICCNDRIKHHLVKYLSRKYQFYKLLMSLLDR